MKGIVGNNENKNIKRNKSNRWSVYGNKLYTEAKIIIDFGEDLDRVKRLEKIEGLTTGEPAYDGVIITHNHQDHMGRIDEILEKEYQYICQI